MGGIRHSDKTPRRPKKNQCVGFPFLHREETYVLAFGMYIETWMPLTNGDNSTSTSEKILVKPMIITSITLLYAVGLCVRLTHQILLSPTGSVYARLTLYAVYFISFILHSNKIYHLSSHPNYDRFMLRVTAYMEVGGMNIIRIICLSYHRLSRRK